MASERKVLWPILTEEREAFFLNQKNIIHPNSVNKIIRRGYIFQN